MKRSRVDPGKRALKRRRTDQHDQRADSPEEGDRSGARPVTRTPPFVKKRRRPAQARQVVRREDNTPDNIGFLNDVYRHYYRNRTRLRGGDLGNSLYRFSGYGDAGYIARPIDKDDFLQFVKSVTSLGWPRATTSSSTATSSRRRAARGRTAARSTSGASSST
jgi:hypothetical protein